MSTTPKMDKYQARGIAVAFIVFMWLLLDYWKPYS